MDVFDAYIADAKRHKNFDGLIDAYALKLAAVRRAGELDAFDKERKAMHTLGVRRGDRNMMAFTMDLHPLEMEAIKALCPELAINQAGDGKNRRKAWAWVMRQPWAESWQPPKIESAA